MAPLSARRRASALVLGVLLLVAGGLGFALTRDAGDEVAEVLTGEPVVILVHGYGGSTADLRVIGDRLRAQGRDVVAVSLPDRGEGELEASADAVGDVVRGYPGRPVDLIGFSLGGVVARQWVADAGTDGVRHVITLGSPHHGTQLAASAGVFLPGACTRACAQMQPSSTFLADLNEDETPAGPDWTTVWTALDRTVTPPETARLEGARDVRVQDVCPDERSGHGGLPRSPLVIGLVLAALSDDLPAVVGPAECARLRTLGS